jgi:hypothetical protein
MHQNYLEGVLFVLNATFGTVNLGFTYGKEDFHGPTIKERQDKQLADAKAGINAEPVGQVVGFNDMPEIGFPLL